MGTCFFFCKVWGVDDVKDRLCFWAKNFSGAGTWTPYFQWNLFRILRLQIHFVCMCVSVCVYVSLCVCVYLSVCVCADCRVLEGANCWAVLFGAAAQCRAGRPTGNCSKIHRDENTKKYFATAEEPHLKDILKGWKSFKYNISLSNRGRSVIRTGEVPGSATTMDGKVFWDQVQEMSLKMASPALRAYSDPSIFRNDRVGWIMEKTRL